MKRRWSNSTTLEHDGGTALSAPPTHTKTGCVEAPDGRPIPGTIVTLSRALPLCDDDCGNSKKSFVNSELV